MFLFTICIGNVILETTFNMLLPNKFSTKNNFIPFLATDILIYLRNRKSDFIFNVSTFFLKKNSCSYETFILCVDFLYLLKIVNFNEHTKELYLAYEIN